MTVASTAFARSPARLVAVVCAAQVLVQIGAFFWPALLPGMMRLWELSNSEAGWITASFYGAYMMSVPVLVTLTDRVDPKRVYLFGVASTAVGHLLFGLLAEGFWSAVILRALTGMGWAGTYMTGLKLLADRVDAKMMSRATAGHAASIGISGALSFATGDLVAALAGWHAAFLAAAASATVAWLLVAAIVPAQGKPAVASKEGQGLYDFRPVFRNRSAMAYAIAYCIHTLEMSALRGWGVAFLGYVAATTGAAAASLLSPAIVATGLGLIGTFASVAGNEAAIRYGRKRLGWQISLYALFGCSLVTCIAIELMSRWYEGAQARARNNLATEA
jgi:predicted MFS family arabinose efflux permease